MDTGHQIIEGAVTIGSLIIGIAALSVIVSPKAQTSQVIQATASGFGNSLAVAMTPVTGEHVNINTSYPTSAYGLSSSIGMPQFGSPVGLN